MNKNFSKFSKLIFVAFISSIFISVSLALILPTVKTHWHFSRLPIALATYDLFDIGVIDANSNGNLDVFTVNHSAKQSLKLGNGKGEFKDVLSAWNLDQDREFPQLEDFHIQPEFDLSGLYIYRQNKALYLHSQQLGEKTIAGTLHLSWPVVIEKQQEFDVEISQQSREKSVQSTVKFTAHKDGWLVIKSKDDIIEIPHSFTIEPQVALTDIYVGLQKINPKSHQFELMWRDRHSMAWTDINRDRQLDVFIGRGGIKGQLDQIDDSIMDELMIRKNQSFTNQVERSGLVKKQCPARQSAWVDFDNDDLLDLYIVCGRNDDPVYPNQLWQQQSDGKYVDVAAQFGVDFPEDGCFRWLDADRDGDMDLLATREETIELWMNQGENFQPQTIVKNWQGKILNLAIADFDTDGDLDAYASSKYIDEPNLLLINDRGSFKAVNPTTIGLPDTGINAAWLDDDNDGLSDFHIVPHGIYHQLHNGRFKATNILNVASNLSQIVNARGVWFDFDNDGARDYLLSTKQPPSVISRLKNKLISNNDVDPNNWQKIWSARLYQNKQSSNHWLQIELVGSLGNPQGIGTLVEVITSKGKQLQQVGNTDNSYYSQGHYRLYFGLGKDERVKAIDLQWSDGQIQHLENIIGDRLITIDKNSSLVK